MGFNFSEKRDLKIFVFEGIKWKSGFLFSRILWMMVGVGLVFIASKFFHRFDLKEKVKSKRNIKNSIESVVVQVEHNLNSGTLPAIVEDYGIYSFIKTELLMLFRKGSRWFWIVNLGGMVALLFVPLAIAHQFILPILWFLQIGRLSDITTKEKTHRIHYFTFASYQPLVRLLPSQIIAGIVLLIALAFPLMLRYIIELQFVSFSGILLGAIFIVMLSAFLGIVSGGKKLFEVLFFALTYANLNSIPFADYFGSTWTSLQAVGIMAMLIFFLTVLSGVIRRYEIRHA
jgi:hypothetical protein